MMRTVGMELSMKNTLLYKQEKLSQYEKLNPEIRVYRLMEQMKKDLRLSELPRHIECFDNSNFQGIRNHHLSKSFAAYANRQD